MDNPTPMRNSSPNPPSKHHYIPEFYLKRWCVDGERFVRYTRPRPNKLDVKRCYPGEAGFEYNLYRSPAQDPHKAQLLETQFFAKVDDLGGVDEFERRAIGHTHRETVYLGAPTLRTLARPCPSDSDSRLLLREQS